jgi:MFS family permease
MNGDAGPLSPQIPRVPSRAPAAAPSSLIALRHRNFRLLWIGQLVSFSGTMMQSAAILWHVSLLVPPGRRGLALGMVGLVRIGPIIAFSLVSGVAADVLDRRRLMLMTQSIMAAFAGVLALSTFRGLHAVWPIYLLAALGSAAAAFDGPARQSLIPNLVPREHLPNAISLNTIMTQIASFAGPSLAGAVIALLGVGWAYLFNAASFLVVIAALLLMREVQSTGAQDAGGSAQPTKISWEAAVDGLRFVFSAEMIRSTMLLDFFATFFSSATALLPIFAQDILCVGAHGYGWLYAAPSFGALVASAGMVRLVEHIERRGWVLLWAVGVYGAATVVFGMSHSFWLTFACLAMSGAADTVSMVLRSIIRQTQTPDHLRGRMTSVNMIFFMGGPQLGELEAGLVANAFGAPLSVVTGGLGSLIATGAIAAATPALRHYRRDQQSAGTDPSGPARVGPCDDATSGRDE